MTATNLIDFNAKRNGGNQVIADTDDGYTRTANAIQDQLCKADLTGAQFRVLSAIIRITYGYNQKTNRITNTYLAELTGVSEKGVRLCLAELHGRNMITLEKSGLMKLVGVNKVISEWVVTTGKSEKQSAKGKVSRNNSSILRRNNGSFKAVQQLPQDGTVVPHKGNSSSSTKDNLKDNLLKTTSKDHVSAPSAPDADLKPDAAIQKGKLWGTAEDLDIANQFDAILKTTLGEHHRPANLALWANDIRLMRTQDKRTAKHMITLFALAHTDKFWKTNIQSPAALRKQWARLASLHSERKSGLGNGQTGITIGADGKPMTAQDWGIKARELAVKL
ncbi:replication protein [Arsukibacterium sp.]|uniref:replication protein n=1 Tax=Arsukibacterium sp. TaxID=1977258 RepID=UPI00299D9593|nr:replication protein [Arsukibacterium sp.]MDX1538848.1 replication protein [Arsukibacterium sp.]